jgi:hypothetical protein
MEDCGIEYRPTNLITAPMWPVTVQPRHSGPALPISFLNVHVSFPNVHVSFPSVDTLDHCDSYQHPIGWRSGRYFQLNVANSPSITRTRHTLIPKRSTHLHNENEKLQAALSNALESAGRNVWITISWAIDPAHAHEFVRRYQNMKTSWFFPGIHFFTFVVCDSSSSFLASGPLDVSGFFRLYRKVTR